MKRLLSGAAAALMLLTAAAHARDEKPSIVTILTAPEPQTQLMAMVLTMQSISRARRREFSCAARPVTWRSRMHRNPRPRRRNRRT